MNFDPVAEFLGRLLFHKEDYWLDGSGGKYICTVLYFTWVSIFCYFKLLLHFEDKYSATFIWKL